MTFNALVNRGLAGLDWTAAPLWLVALATIPSCMFVTFMAFQPWIPPGYLFDDTLTVASLVSDAGEPCCAWYFGFVSNLGILLWAGTAAVCALSALIFHSRPRGTYRAVFFLYGGALTAWLALDDLYKMHEKVHWSGIHEAFVFAVYMLLVLVYLVTFRRLIVESGFVLLFLSFAFFSMSILVDTLHPGASAWHHLGDDGSKFVGISLWTAFHLCAAWIAIDSDMDRRQALS